MEQIEKLKKAIETNANKGDYLIVRKNYLEISKILKKQGDQKEKLRYLLLAIYVDLSGMSDYCVVEEYEKLSRAFKVTIWKEIKNSIQNLKLNDNEIIQLIRETIKKYAISLPFVYFDIEILIKIIMDKLKDEENLLQKYEEFHNKVDLRNTDYKIEIKKGNSLEEIPSNYVIVDIETTGLNPKTDSIIEVGCIKFRNGKEFGRYESIIKTPKELSSKIKRMTGLSDEILNEAPEMKTIAPRLWAFLKNEIIVGHNINFDIQFLYINFYEILGKEFTNDYVDTLKIFKRAYPRLKSYSLENLCNKFKICAGHHRAIVDCLIVEEIINRMRKSENKITIIEEGITEESASKYVLNLVKKGIENYEQFEIILEICNELVEKELLSAKACKKVASICEEFEEYTDAVEFYQLAMDIEPDMDFTKKIERLEKKI
ncbi:MAG: 3'-5' exonuclease [Selenomonadaceae bacterium]|nr:3'-5' exonuclease [Selenomonadaceae bacterium]